MGIWRTQALDLVGSTKFGKFLLRALIYCPSRPNATLMIWSFLRIPESKTFYRFSDVWWLPMMFIELTSHMNYGPDTFLEDSSLMSLIITKQEWRTWNLLLEQSLSEKWKYIHKISKCCSIQKSDVAPMLRCCLLCLCYSNLMYFFKLIKKVLPASLLWNWTL